MPELLKADIIIAKTCIDKFNSLKETYGQQKTDEQLIDMISISKQDLFGTEWICRRAGFVIDPNVNYFSYLNYFKDVFKLKPENKFRLVTEGLKDEKGQINLSAFFVGMFVPHYYSSVTFNAFEFEERDAYRTNGPWARYSWERYSTSNFHIPGERTNNAYSNPREDAGVKIHPSLFQKN